MREEVDVGHLRSWIGRVESAEELLTPAHAERVHATLGFAGDAPKEGEAAPRFIHFCLCQPAAAMEELGRDGHPALGGFLPPVPFPRRMWAGGDFTFSGDILIGQRVSRRSEIVDVTVKQGRTGSLCFVVVRHEISAGGHVAVQEKQTIVYRQAGNGASAGAVAEPAPTGDICESLMPSSTLLFRYSALTFNGHRIHYDEPFATQVEGYPGLVFHGPLQATLLYHLAARQRGGAPADHFTFRSVSPLFDRQPVLLHAKGEEQGGMALWTSHPGGPVAMQARVW